MQRDFSENAKQKLLEYVKEVTETTLWGKIADGICDAGLQVQYWFGALSISKYINNLDEYHKKIIDKNNITADRIEEIFEKVKNIDKRYGDGLKQNVNFSKSVATFVQNLADTIDPNGGNLDMQKMQGALAASLEKIYEAQTSREKIIEGSMLGIDPEGANKSVDPVNLSTGNFIYDHKDLNIYGEIPLCFHRYYNSRDTKILTLGKCFRHNFDIALSISDDNKVDITLEDGQHRLFEKDNSVFINLSGAAESLECVAKGYAYTSDKNIVYLFDINGTLQRIEDLNGRGIDLQYNENKQLIKTITDNGTWLMFSYNEDGFISEVVDISGRMLSFEYDNNYLQKITLPENVTISYLYARNGRIRQVVNTYGQAAVENEYDNSIRVVKQKFLDNGTMSFLYDDHEGTVTQIERNGVKTVYVHDEQYRNIETRYHDGSVEKFIYNSRNQCVSKSDRNGNITRYAYDNRGNVTQIIDSRKKKSNFTYDAYNRIRSVSINSATKLKYEYDKCGNLLCVEDALGNRTSCKYDSCGRKVFEENADGTHRYVYDENGNVVEIYQNDVLTSKCEYDLLNRVSCEIDAKGNSVTYEYDELNRIKRILRSDGCTKELFYNGFNEQPTKIVDFDGSVLEDTFDKLGRISSQKDKNGGITKYTYDLMWNVASVEEPNGAITRYEYNADNRLSRIILPNDGEIVYEYDFVGNRTKMIDPEGNVTLFEYNCDNTVKSVLEANGARTSYEYDFEGNLVKILDAENNEVILEYDSMGNRVGIIDEYGRKTSYEYTKFDRIKKITYANGGSVEYEYDDMGRLSKFVDEDGGTENYTYDMYGNVATKKVDGETTEFEYDNWNRVNKIINPVGGTRLFVYDVSGNVVSITDERNVVINYTYYPNNLMKSVNENNIIETLYEYDSVGNITSVKKIGDRDAIQVTSFEWDILGNLAKTVDPLGNTEEYSYTKSGKVKSKIDAEGYVTSYNYNMVGDVEEIIYDDNRKAQFKYNLLKQLVSVTDWNGETSILLNKQGMPLQVKDYNGNVIQYEWGNRNEKKKVVYPDETVNLFKYNASNQLVELSIGDKVTKYSYDEYGRFTSRTNNDGTKTQYEYNELGRIKRIVNSSNNFIVDELNYQYDNAGNKIKTIQTQDGRNTVFEYGYDAVGRLSGITNNGTVSVTYCYDSFGNRIMKNDYEKDKTTEYFYNANNQLLKEVHNGVSIDYEYDRRGNLILINSPEKTLLYAFDTANQLHEVEKTIGLEKSSKVYSFGQLGNKVVDTIETGNSIVQSVYYTDLTRKCQNILGKQVKVNGNVISDENYYYDGKIMAMSKKHGELSYFLGDDHGSCTTLFHADKLFHIGYDVFGERINDHEAPTEFGYTSYMLDEFAEAYFAFARLYDPRTGRFISQDKFRGIQAMPQTLNRYTYCCNRPEDYEDDDGEWITVVVGAVVGGLVSAAISTGTQVIKGVKEGKSVGEAFKDVDYKKVAIDAAKGAIKGAIAGTGIGVVASAAANAAVDMAGDVAEQTVVEGKSLAEVDKSKTVETGIFSFGFSLAVGGASKAIKNKIADKLHVNGELATVGQRYDAKQVVKEQLERAKASSRITKLTGRLAEKTHQLWTSIGKYTINQVYGGIYGYVQGELYKNELKSWATGGMDYLWHCKIAA